LKSTAEKHLVCYSNVVHADGLLLTHEVTFCASSPVITPKRLEWNFLAGYLLQPGDIAPLTVWRIYGWMDRLMV
jgi:uncharacterized membrane protein YkvA (DUF1232 family)